jgi:hypothetical protein
MEKFTIHMGHTAALGHSGTLGRGPSRRPLGQPIPAGVASARGHRPGACLARGVARGSTARRRVIGDEVFGIAIPTTLAT